MRAPDLVLAFSAQGGQWPGMGAALYREDVVFREAIDRCALVIRDRMGWALAEEMSKDAGAWRLHRDPECVQPALTALQIALVDVLADRGLRPQATLGLSMGEVAAAYAAGALDRADALDVVCTQARLTARPLRPGGMVVAAASAASTCASISEDGEVSIAVELAPEITVLSGEAEAVSRAASRLTAAGVHVTPVSVGYAFHSSEVAPLREEFIGALKGLRPRPTSLPFYSAARGGPAEGSLLGPEHWWSIMSRGARFVAAGQAALSAGGRVFLEVGPHPMLQEPLHAIARACGLDVACRAVMSRADGSDGALTGVLARLAADQALLQGSPMS